MHYLSRHEPVAHVFRQKTHSLIRIQLSVGENPEDNEQYSQKLSNSEQPKELSIGSQIAIEKIIEIF